MIRQSRIRKVALPAHITSTLSAAIVGVTGEHDLIHL
jgi:hypothetical protein